MQALKINRRVENARKARISTFNVEIRAFLAFSSNFLH